MLKPILGILLGLLIGVFCRFFEIPLPGPPAILGAFIAVAMATGYTVTDRMLTSRKPPSAPSAAVTGAAGDGQGAKTHE
jgi:XapX domain-containing protein